MMIIIILCMSMNSTAQRVGNTAFPRRWCNNKILGNFKCPNNPPNPVSQAIVPPQSHPWNSKYLTEHKHRIFQIQYILVAEDTDYVKPLTRGSGIMYAWTYIELPCSAEVAMLVPSQWVNNIQAGSIWFDRFTKHDFLLGRSVSIEALL